MYRYRSAAAAAALIAALGCAGVVAAHDSRPNKAAVPVSAAPTDATFQEAARALDAFHAALARGDTAAAAAAFSDDALIFEQGGVERSKAEYADHHLPGDAAYAQATKYTLNSRGGLALGDLAYVVSEGRTVGKYREKDVDRVTLETAVLRRSREGWKIVHVHWSSRGTPTQS